MDNRNTNMTFGNTVISWGIAGLAGLIAFLLFRIMGDWSWSAAGFGGGFIAVILIVLFTIIFGRDLPPLGSINAPSAKRTAPAAPKAAPAASAAVAAGSAGMGGGGAAATSPAATGTPVGEGARDASTRTEASLAHETAKATPASTPAAPAPSPVADTTPGTKPETLTAPRGGTADDLKRIKGVGPKLEQVCNDLGFYHFDQIAAWSADEIAWVDENLEGFKGRVTRDEWVSQAKVLAAGEETEFSGRVDKGDVY